MTERSDPQQLAQAIAGLSDEQLRKEIDNLGVDSVLSGIFEAMPEYFAADRAQGVEATILYNVETPQGVQPWTVEVADGTCRTSAGAAEDPRLTLELQDVDFVKLVFGEAQGPQLFMTGKLRLKGDMMFAMQMQRFFETPA